MLVKDLMSTNVITVSPETKISEVAQIIHEHHYTGVPVVNNEGRVLGTISESDFITAGSDLYLPTYISLLSSMDYVQGAKKGLPHVVDQVVNATAKDILNQKVPFAKLDTSLEQLAAMFVKTNVNPIPVTDANNKLLGIISRSDLIKFFTPKEVMNSYKAESRSGPPSKRLIDSEIAYTQSHFTSTFAYVAKARANIWLTATVVLFIVGFLGGVIYVADPSIFSSAKSKTSTTTNYNQQP